jgi:hypothetical protein
MKGRSATKTRGDCALRVATTTAVAAAASAPYVIASAQGKLNGDTKTFPAPCALNAL